VPAGGDQRGPYALGGGAAAVQGGHGQHGHHFPEAPWQHHESAVEHNLAYQWRKPEEDAAQPARKGRRTGDL